MKTFFIAGMQRSGTTLLSVMLGKHPDIYMQDRSTIFRVISAFKNATDILPHNLEMSKSSFYQQLIKNDYKGRLAALLDSDKVDKYASIKALIHASLEQDLRVNGKVYWADKAPNLQHYIPDLLMLLPEAKIVHIVRDGRANALSISKRSYQSLLLSAQQWVDGNTFGLVNQDVLGASRYQMIKYEDLLTDPEACLRQICSFLDLSYSDQMVDLAGGDIPEAQRYVKSKIDNRKISAFRQQLTPKQIKKIEQIQAPLLNRLGYEILFAETGQRYRPLGIGQQIWLSQRDNLRLLFRASREGMVDRQLVTTKMPFKNRLYDFLEKLCRDLFSHDIYKAFFERKYFKVKKFTDEPIPRQASE